MSIETVQGFTILLRTISFRGYLDAIYSLYLPLILVFIIFITLRLLSSKYVSSVCLTVYYLLACFNFLRLT